jgi:hypothetical protein
LWRRRYAADSAILGRAIGLNGMPFTIIGVMQPDFRGITDRAQALSVLEPVPPAQAKPFRTTWCLTAYRPSAYIPIA